MNGQTSPDLATNNRAEPVVARTQEVIAPRDFAACSAQDIYQATRLIEMAKESGIELSLNKYN